MADHTRLAEVKRDLTAAVTASVGGSLAVFLVGALAIQIRGSLHFGTFNLGIALSAYYLAAGLGAIPFGKLAEDVGGIRVLRVAVLAAAVMLGLIAAMASSWGVLVLLLFAAGLASSAVQPAVNLFLARRMPRGRQGLAFGIKQASVPTAAMLGGFAVPAVALTLGWRAAFVMAAVLVAPVALLLPRPRLTVSDRRSRTERKALPAGWARPLMVLSAGFTLASFASSSLTAFIVTSAVHTGVSKGDAGLLAAAGAAGAVTARILLGARADRRDAPCMSVVSSMLATGGAAYVLLAVGSAQESRAFLVVGAMLAFGAGWGWNGLFTFAVVRGYPDAPARASSIIQVGGRLAGIGGPLGFGFLATHDSYATAWSVDAAAVALAAAVMAWGSHLLRRLPRPLDPGKVEAADAPSKGLFVG